VSFVAITFCVASQRVFIVVSVFSLSTKSGNFWIHPRTQSRCRAVEGANSHSHSSKTGIVGSNPARDMEICPRFSVLCCPVKVEALTWANPPFKERSRNV